MTNSIINVVSKPTTNAGQLRLKDWTTDLHNAMESGVITATVGENQVTFTHEGIDYTVEAVTAYASALAPAFKGDVSLKSALTYLSNGCLSPRMLSVQEHIADKGLNPVRKQEHVLTAEQYETNCYIMNLDKKNLANVQVVMVEAGKLTDKSTKAELLQVIHGFEAIFIDSTQKANHALIVENELKDAAKFQGLTDRGFINIARSGVFLTAHLACNLGINIQKTLLELGYELTDTSINMSDPDNMLFVVSFTELEIDEEQES